MPFRAILQSLLDSFEGSIGALFLDWEGEAVALVGPYHERFDLHLAGAYQGIFLNQLRKASANVSLGEIRTFKIGFREATFFNSMLTDGYYLVLIAENDVPDWLAWDTLNRGRKMLLEEM
ncbi:MAG: hypothetical protein R3338_14525 [Thermoanaerobaculia bacterium]|nr:hypothetical protein [Thermoanaerobaculia bacterium]